MIAIKFYYLEPTTKFIYKQVFFIPLVFLVMIFVFTPLLLLCLYPTKLCKIITKCFCCCSPRQQNALLLFMDCFQGHYKNGTTGTYNYRSVSSIGFILRFIVCYSMNGAWSRKQTINNELFPYSCFLSVCFTLSFDLARNST